nr:uncharacterized protein LOC129381852 [Dermacentor andersoni]
MVENLLLKLQSRNVARNKHIPWIVQPVVKSLPAKACGDAVQSQATRPASDATAPSGIHATNGRTCTASSSSSSSSWVPATCVPAARSGWPTSGRRATSCVHRNTYWSRTTVRNPSGSHAFSGTAEASNQAARSCLHSAPSSSGSPCLPAPLFPSCRPPSFLRAVPAPCGNAGTTQRPFTLSSLCNQTSDKKAFPHIPCRPASSRAVSINSSGCIEATLYQLPNIVHERSK